MLPSLKMLLNCHPYDLTRGKHTAHPTPTADVNSFLYPPQVKRPNLKLFIELQVRTRRQMCMLSETKTRTKRQL